MTSPSQQSQEDPFDTLLSLESQYHAEGRALGISEGSLSGRIEGRVFGLEKSFEKFIELGRLGGRAAVWNARLPSSSPTLSSASPSASASTSTKLEVGKEEAEAGGKLGVLPGSQSERLVRHVKRMAELTDADDVSRENSEDGVQDFDDRLREARAKAVLVERLVGESGKEGGSAGGSGAAAAVKRAGVKGNAAVKSDEMEDFGGLPRGLLQKK